MTNLLKKYSDQFSWKFFRGTFRGRLILSVAAVHAVMMSFFIFDFTCRQRSMFLDRQTEEAAALSQALATSSAVWIASHDLSGLQEIVDSQSQYPEVIFVYITDSEGQVLAGTDKSRLGLYILDLPLAIKKTVVSKTPSLVDVAAPAVISGQHVGWARVGIGQKESRKTLARITRNGIIYTILAISIGSFIAWFMGQRISRRLYNIQETFEAVRFGNRKARSNLSGNDEAAMLARDFNSMLDVIEARDAEIHASQKRFKSLIEIIQVAILVHDDQGKILIANPLALELIGFSIDEIRGEIPGGPYRSFVKEDGSVMPFSEYPESLVLNKKKSVKNYIVGIKRPDRNYITWVLVNAEPDFNIEGKIDQVIVSFIDITERRLVEAALRESEQKFSAAFQASPAMMAITRVSDGAILEVNEGYTQMLGYSRAESVGRTTESLSLWANPDDRVVFIANLKKNGKINNFETQLRRKDGMLVNVIDSARAIKIKGEDYILSVAYNITERKRTEEALIRLNRELRAISNCNEVLMRAADEKSLLKDICNIICVQAGYRMAWVGYAEHNEQKTVAIASSAGFDDGYLSNAHITWDDSERGHGPTGTAIRTGKSVCIQDFLVDAQAAPWRESALQRGYRSSIALPLKDDYENTFGVLNIYSAEPDTFVPDEIRLLEELAQDLAFGITILRAREERQNANEKIMQLAAIVESSEDAILGETLEGIITSWNKGAEKIYGYSENEIIGQSFSILIPAEKNDEFLSIIENIKAGHHMNLFETKRKRKDGQIIDVSVSISPVKNSSGEIVSASVIAREITESKRNSEINMSRLRLMQFSVSHTLGELLEETLNEAEKLTGSKIGFYHFVDDDQESLTLQDWSTKTKNEFCKAEGKGLHYPISEAGVWVECIKLRKAVIHNDYASLPNRKGMPEGHAVVVRELVVPVLRGEKVRAILGVGNKEADYTEKDSEVIYLLADLAWEIAERKMIENEIFRINQSLEQRVAERTSQLEAANEELESFSYSVSHDLRAPLRHIEGFLGILKEKIEKTLDNESLYYMASISEAIGRMDILIDDLLSFSRMGRAEISKVEFDLAALLNEIIRDFEPDTKERSVEWRVSKMPAIYADRAMMRVVLFNLISNALKYTRTRAKAEIEIGCETDKDTETIIFVRDNGVGFDMKYSGKLFGVFQRLHSIEEFEGTGIGLANVRRVISRHGGRTWAEGKENEGAAFYFSIPNAAKSN